MATKAKTMDRPLSAEPLDRWPGDTASRLTAPATDETGKVWPAGTVYHPLSGGADQSGPRGQGQYKTVTIDGARVTFRFDRLYRGM